MRRLFLVLPVLALAIAIEGCGSSRNEQQAQQSEAAAAKAQQAAEQAEQDAAKAQVAADKATEAANRATKAVQDATIEINRVADHLDQMQRDREAALHRRRRSHVTKAAAGKTAVASGTPEAAPSPSTK
jgi:uncharacterized protein YceK